MYLAIIAVLVFLAVILLATIAAELRPNGKPTQSRTVPMPPADPTQQGMVRLLHDGVFHSIRPEGHPDVLAVRAGQHPGMTAERVQF